MDTARVPQGTTIAAVAGVLLVLFTFLPWFGSSLGLAVPEGQVLPEALAKATRSSQSLWQADGSLDLYLFIVGIAAVLPALLGSGERRGRMPIGPAAVTTLLGAIGTLLVFYRLLDVPAPYTRKAGLYLGFLAVIGVTIGGYMAMQEQASERDYDRY
jgi:hypothetical protein